MFSLKTELPFIPSVKGTLHVGGKSRALTVKAVSYDIERKVYYVRCSRKVFRGGAEEEKVYESFIQHLLTSGWIEDEAFTSEAEMDFTSTWAKQ